MLISIFIVLCVIALILFAMCMSDPVSAKKLRDIANGVIMVLLGGVALYFVYLIVLKQLA